MSLECVTRLVLPPFARMLLLPALLLVTGCVSPQRVSLADLPLVTTVRQGWGNPQADRSVQERPLSIGGRQFRRGVGTHAHSVLHVALDGRAERFTAYVGVDDETEGQGSVRFKIYSEKNRLFDSGIMTGGQPARRVDVPLTGVRHLVLMATAADDGIGWDHADWADATFHYRGVAPQTVPPPSEEAIMLTPRPSPAPQLNNALAYGARPGHPFLYRIPTTGERPINFAVDNLPASLRLDPTTGIITGTTPSAPGEYALTLHAVNAHGRTERPFKLVVGDTLALTPPMGWNSWYIYFDRVTDAGMRAAADALLASGMADFGYSYVNIDDCWAVLPGSPDPELGGEPRDAVGNIRSNARFPDMRALTDYIHGLGLKAGIYTSPGPTTCAGYTGSGGHEEQDARQFAAWGFDFLKYDWCSYGRRDPSQPREYFKAPYQKMGDILKTLDRDIIYNICQYGMDHVWEWGAAVGGHCWRTTDDLGNEGGALSRGIYLVGLATARLDAYARPGAWNDPDYILIGMVGDENSSHPTTLTPNEQYTHMSLWCLLAAPLIFSGDPTQLDAFTLNVLCNAEVIAVDQDPLGRPGRVIQRDEERLILAKPLVDGSVAVGLFNLAEVPQEITVSWKELGLAPPRQLRDLWRQQNLPIHGRELGALVPRHGVFMVRCVP